MFVAATLWWGESNIGYNCFISNIYWKYFLEMCVTLYCHAAKIWFNDPLISMHILHKQFILTESSIVWIKSCCLDLFFTSFNLTIVSILHTVLRQALCSMQNSRTTERLPGGYQNTTTIIICFPIPWMLSVAVWQRLWVNY